MAVATLREARGVYGATLGFPKRRLTGREPAPVASFFPRGARRRGNGMSTNERGRVRPTHEWDLLVPLFERPEQKRYEEIRPLVLFDVSVAERAEEVGLSQSTLYRRLGGFEAEGMESLFASETARKRKLPPAVRRLIVDLKAEYPPFNLNEIANAVRACFGRKPDVRSVERVLDGAARPLRLERNYPRYHEMDSGEGRAAVVELRVDGWSAKAIAGYLGIGRSTVYKILKRFEQEGAEGLADKPHGRPSGVRKVTLAAIEEARRLARSLAEAFTARGRERSPAELEGHLGSGDPAARGAGRRAGGDQRWRAQRAGGHRPGRGADHP
jgi:transposase